MSNRTQALLLLLFGVALLRLGTSDLLLRFVKESARPWVVIAGAVMLLLAVWSLVAAARGDTDDVEHGDEHGHGAASRSAWLIVLPVIAVLVIGPPALGRYTVNQRDPITPVSADDDFPPLPATDPARLRLFDLALRSVSDRASLRNRTVQVDGFVAGRAAGRFTLARLVITCCAADAAPVTVSVRSAERVSLNAWVRVTGRYAGQSPADANVPVLDDVSVTSIAAPAEQYD